MSAKRENLVELYQIEECPFCRGVREKLQELGLDYIVRTVDKDDRSRVKEVSGQENVPVIVDQKNDVIMPESDDIIEYINENYSKFDE